MTWARFRAAAGWVLLALAGYALGAAIAWAVHPLIHRAPPAPSPLPAIFSPMPQVPSKNLVLSPGSG